MAGGEKGSLATEVLAVLAACRQSIFSVAVFSFVANLLMLVPAFFMLSVYDKAVAHNSLPTLWVLALVALFLFFVLGIMEYVRAAVLSSVATRMDKVLGSRTFDATLIQAAVLGPERSSLQPLVDLNDLRQFLTSNGIISILDAPWLPIYLIVLFLFHPMLGWLGVAAAAALLTLALLNQRATAGPLSAAAAASAHSQSENRVLLRTAEVAAALGMLPDLSDRYREQQDSVLQGQQAASESASLFRSVSKTLRLTVQSAAIAAGAYLVIQQEISPGMLIAGSLLVGRALAPVDSLIASWRGFEDAKQQFYRLNDLYKSLPPETEVMDLPPIEAKIVAANAAIRPPTSNVPTIAGLNFTLSPGDVCAIIGPSGAGKSSAIRGLLGLWPASFGRLTIDGMDATAWDRSALGRQIGYLPQDIELLGGSIANNIARFGEVDSEKVIRAATDCGLHQFILSLPNGYDTDLASPQANLSPGIRQRLALARAVYDRPRFVVLDEPNSNLDERGEIALSHTIKTLKASGSTVVIVSHRKSIVPLADYLLVLAEGRQVHFDTRDKVVAALQPQQQPVLTGGDVH